MSTPTKIQMTDEQKAERQAAEKRERIAAARKRLSGKGQIANANHTITLPDGRTVFAEFVVDAEWDDARFRRRNGQTVFIDNVPDPDMERPPYGSSRGDGSDEDKAWQRYNKAEIAIHRAIVSQVLGVELKDVKFSRRAGCSCPCSPGLVLSGNNAPARTVEGIRPQSITIIMEGWDA